METEPNSLREEVPLEEILQVFSTSDSLYYPVVDAHSQLVGAITIPYIKEMFANREVAGWLLACDVAEPVRDKTTPDKPRPPRQGRSRGTLSWARPGILTTVRPC